MKNTLQITLVVILIFSLCWHIQSKSNYRVVSKNVNTTTISLTLEYTGTDQYYIKQTSPIVKKLNFVFHALAFNDFYFKITDSQNQRYQIPQTGIFPIDPFQNFSFPISALPVSFTYTESPFDFKIIRKINSGVIFSTYDKNIIYSNYYIEIGTEVSSQYVYGLGERFLESFRKKNGKWTIFNRDRGQVIDRGQGYQTYGYYPFFLAREKNNFFHVNYFRSSNAMDAVKEEYLGQHYLTFKVIGGIIDFRFFLGEQSPELAIEKFNLYFGRSEIPPFWGFGFHQCRWGYENVSYLKNVLDNYEKNDLPLDTIWNDIDYMIDYEDFTIDESRFPLDQMKKITDKYRYIPIIDAGIKNSGSSYEEGLKRGVFIKDALGKEPLVGKVWPGSTTFVDFFHPNATQYWIDMLGNLYNKVQFSGIWLDMNELANFCDGPCNVPKEKSFDYSNDLPFQPGSDNIQSHTISLNSTHYGNVSEANVHAYAAFLETYATNQFLKSKGLKPFIITRSSTFGSNKFGFHWTGDNRAEWDYLKGSIPDNFNNQLWGFQMVGPDICGFGGDTNEQLCARWFQLGSLYPFARNHNDKQSKSQEPYALGNIVLQSAHTNLKLRYSLLKYYYSTFINKRGIGTIFKPLFFAFPTDPNAYLDEMDSQFLIGANLMAAPIVEQGKTSRKVYFPQVIWYNLYSGVEYKAGTTIIEGISLTDKVPLYLREGTAVLLQDTTEVTSTRQLGNRFILYGGFRYDSRRSTKEIQVYEAVGGILSIKDYNDDAKVDLCYREGCEYILNMILSVEGDSQNLELDVSYAGGFRLNEQIFIDEVKLYYNEFSATKKLTNPIEITGPRKIIVPINQAKHLSSQQLII